MSEIVTGFALLAIVLIATPLVSGLVDRSPVSFAFLFLVLGLVIGEGGIGILEMDSHSKALETVATLTLALVLFLDAVKLQVRELRARWVVPVLVLGPGTFLIIGLGAAAISWLIGLPLVMALIGGAILASTDPVVLREVIRDPRIPRSIRQVLRIEAGMNDIVVLPAILILIAVAGAASSSVTEWSAFLFKLLLLGPAIGFVIGGVGSWAMLQVDARMPIRTELQSLYGLGMVFGSFAAGTAVGGDGFLAAFAAGLAVVLLNQSLCDCFLDYGEVTSEMVMLLSFILFGVVLSSILGDAPLFPTIGLAALVIFVFRPLSLGLVLARTRMSWEAKAFVGWFGPRGLNSLLLALLVIHADLEDSGLLLATVGLVVLISTIIHGASATPLTGWYSRRMAGSTHEEERETDAAGILGSHDAEEPVPRITPSELYELVSEGEAVTILDVRSRSSYDHDKARIPGDIRVLPDLVADWAGANKPDRRVVAYCT